LPTPQKPVHRTRKGRKARLFRIAEILEIALEGSLKTHIMYKAGLSYRDLVQLIDLLLDLGLIEVTGKGRHKTYKTTEKGMRYLQSYIDIRNLMQEQKERVEPAGANRLAVLIDTCLSDIADLKGRVATIERNVTLARELLRRERSVRLKT